MNKVLVIIALLFPCFRANAQDHFDINQYANIEKYREANMKLGLPSSTDPRVVFMGNSITEVWPVKSPDFFKKNGYIGRGIGGQVTHQMLLRFRADVIDLQPKVVVILAGTNDIAQNSGFVTLDDMAKNIFSMAELADYHGIKIILCSVLPAIDYPWRPGLQPAQKIVTLNEMLRKYAAEHNFQYVDYHSHMADEKGGLKVPDYTSEDDLVHPNLNGYKIMERLVQPGIEKALNNESL